MAKNVRILYIEYQPPVLPYALKPLWMVWVGGKPVNERYADYYSDDITDLARQMGIDYKLIPEGADTPYEKTIIIS